ncbi:MAG: ABC transporter substrate-binding protein [Spirochaetota bacterium]
MKKSILALFALLVAATMAFAGGQQQGGQSAPEDAGTGTETLTESGLPRSETVIAAILTGRVGSPSNFNEWVGWKSRDRGMQQLMNEPLWSVDFATGEIIPGLADGDAEYDSDFTQVTIPLKEGVMWSDGEEFTADDVVFTTELIMEIDGLNNHSMMVENVSEVYAEDDYTVVFELNKPNSRFHTNFLDRWGCVWIMPEHVFSQVDDVLTYEYNPPLSTGPYVLHSYDPGGQWTIWEKREDWQDTPTGMMYGEPVPQYFVFRNFDNEGAKIVAQLTHQLDVVDLSPSGMNAALVQGDTNRAYQEGYPYVVNNDPAITGVVFNTLRAPYDNPDVRWALLLAIDIQEYMAQAVDGQATLSPVHIPSLGAYPDAYIRPMEEWLSNFTLDLGNGETFAPYDPDAPDKIVEYARGRGYIVPEGQEVIDRTFGLGWYKHSPEAAAALLEKNGFSRNSDGEWLMPDGSPWQLEILTATNTSSHGYLNGSAASQQWKQFGIDVTLVPSDNDATLVANGQFDVSTAWPAYEPWGAGVDLYRTVDRWNSEYVRPIGERTQGQESHWSSSEMDAVIEQMRNTDPNDREATIAVGMDALKLAVEAMPGIPVYGYTGFTTWDTYYWSNWPFAENAYTQPYTHWGPLKYMTPFLEPTGR